MTTNPEDGDLLDRLIGQTLEQPFPEGPPEEVRRRVLALGQTGPRPGPSNRFPCDPSLSAWLRTVVAAASLFLVTDLCWRLYANSSRPACWFRGANSDTWLVMYENARVEISSPPKDLRQSP